MGICVIIPYFGKLPDHFELWYESCAKNKKIDWLLITDVKQEFTYYRNIKVINKDISWVNDLIKSKIGNKHNIDMPYKLCDYRPLYGILFEDFIDGYAYWGYCDMDLIFGDIDTFLTDELKNHYDMMQIWGHFTLIKNDMDFLMTIREELKDKFQLEKILDSKVVWAVDEYAFPAINKKLGKSIFMNYEIIADIVPYRKKFHINNDYKKKHVFKYINGKVFGYYLDEDQNLKCCEYMYIHFQKRRLLIKDQITTNEYFITEDGFTNETFSLKEKLLAPNNLLDEVILKLEKNIKKIKKLFILIKEKNLISSIRYRSVCRREANNKMIKLVN